MNNEREKTNSKHDNEECSNALAVIAFRMAMQLSGFDLANDLSKNVGSSRHQAGAAWPTLVPTMDCKAQAHECTQAEVK